MMRIIVQGRIEGKISAGRRKYLWIRNLKERHNIIDVDVFIKAARK